MRKVLLFCLLLCGICAAQSKVPTFDGVWWKTLDSASKAAYLLGIAHGRIDATSSCFQLRTKLQPLAVYSDEEWAAFCSHRALDPVGWMTDDFVARIDHFYLDDRNQKIIVVLAVDYLREEVDKKARADYDAAKARADLDSELTTLRKTAAEKR